MAIYHYRMQNIGRRQNRSAVAAAAYRAGTKLYDKELSKELDYREKESEVIHSEILLPKYAPAQFKDRETLWNAVHEKESDRDARLAREFCIAIPNELPAEQSKRLIHDFAKSLCNEGMCVDANIHWKDGNHHAHIMCTTRGFREDGSWDAKCKNVYLTDENGERIPIIDKKTGKQKVDSRNRKQWKRGKEDVHDWNKKEKLMEWRERWEEYCNEYLATENKIDCRSYEEQGIELIPTLHEGPIARNMEARGEIVEVCERNRQIKAANDELRNILERINALQKMKELLTHLLAKKKAEQESAKPYTLTPATDWTHRNFDADIESARRRAAQARESKTRNFLHPDIDL